MAKSTKNKLTITEPIIISFPDAAAPHAAAFKGSKNVHKKGHIWLTNYGTGSVELTFDLLAGGDYTFQTNPAHDGTSAIFINTDPNQVNGFKPPVGAFSNPQLSNNNQSLTITVHSIDAVKYFYILNIQYKGGPSFPIGDPIIVNR